MEKGPFSAPRKSSVENFGQSLRPVSHGPATGLKNFGERLQVSHIGARNWKKTSRVCVLCWGSCFGRDRQVFLCGWVVGGGVRGVSIGKNRVGFSEMGCMRKSCSWMVANSNGCLWCVGKLKLGLIVFNPLRSGPALARKFYPNFFDRFCASAGLYIVVLNVIS